MSDRILGLTDDEQHEYNRVSGRIIGAAIRVHREVGPGLLESIYRECVAFELEQEGFRIEREVAIPFHYRSKTFRVAFRADLIVNGLVLVELKCAEALHPVNFRQVSTYLALTGLRLGLLINFNEQILANGIRRIAS